MAELTPLYMDIDGVYSGDELGLPWRDVVGEGIAGSGSLGSALQVSAGSGNSVNIGAGYCWIVGDTDSVRQPTYRCINDAVVNRGITPDGSNPRRVLVVAQITDEAFAGTGRKWEILAIHGTPAASPVVPAVPASAIPLAEILVPAGAASSAGYTITDRRAFAKIGSGRLEVNGLWQKIAEGAIANTTAFDISNIPLTYRHLKLIVRAVAASGAQTGLYMRFQGDSSNVYDHQQFDANGATLTGIFTNNTNAALIGYVDGSTEHVAITEVLIPNYREAQARTIISAYSAMGGSAGRVGQCGAIWANATVDVVTQINLIAANAFNASLSTYSLYGAI